MYIARVCPQHSGASEIVFPNGVCCYAEEGDEEKKLEWWKVGKCLAIQNWLSNTHKAISSHVSKIIFETWLEIALVKCHYT